MTHPIKLSGLSTMEDLTSTLKNSSDDKLAVVMFTASWCGPCRGIKKKIYDDTSREGMSNDLKNDARFFYVDIDDNKNLASYFKITSIPHFFLMKYGKDGVEIKGNFKGGSELTHEKILKNL
jgi:thiol-disulfide isomerase/thioredoxin